MALFSSIISKVEGVLEPVLGPLRSIYNIVVHTRDTVSKIIDSIQQSADHFDSIVSQVRSFSLKANFKTRVISIPKAREHFTDFVAALKDLQQIAKDTWAQIKSAGSETEAEPAAVAEDLAQLEETAAKSATKIGKLGGKLIEKVAVVLMYIELAQKIFDELQKFLADVDEIVSDINMLDGLFLPQRNARKTISTDDGPIKIRIGALHNP